MPKHGKRSHSDNELSGSDSDTPVTVSLGDTVTLTKREWLAKGHELLERAWYDMVRHQHVKEVKEKLIREQQMAMEGRGQGQMQIQEQGMQADPPPPPQQQQQQQGRGQGVIQGGQGQTQGQGSALQEQGSLAR